MDDNQTLKISNVANRLAFDPEEYVENKTISMEAAMRFLNQLGSSPLMMRSLRFGPIVKPKPFQFLASVDWGDPYEAPPEQWPEEGRVKIEALLRRSLELLERGWTAGAYAKTRLGRDIGPTEETAEEFCAVGALQRGASDLSLGGVFYYALEALVCDSRLVMLMGPIYLGSPRKGTQQRKIEAFNDCSGRAETIALFERTIKRIAVRK